MRLADQSKGKKFLYSLVPFLALLVTFGYAGLLGLLIFFFVLSKEFLYGTNGFGDLLLLLAFPVMIPIIYAFWFNLRFMDSIFGKPALTKQYWKYNSIIVITITALTVLGFVVGLIIGEMTVFVAAVPNLIILGVMWYPYWLRKKYPELMLIGGESTALPNSSPPRVQPQSVAPAQSPQSPAAPSDMPTPQS
jgi:hypothetical protein